MAGDGERGDPLHAGEGYQDRGRGDRRNAEGEGREPVQRESAEVDRPFDRSIRAGMSYIRETRGRRSAWK